MRLLHHPYNGVLVVEDEHFDKAIASGEWYAHPLEAKKVRLENEIKRLHDETRQSLSDRKQPPKHESRSKGIDATISKVRTR